MHTTYVQSGSIGLRTDNPTLDHAVGEFLMAAADLDHASNDWLTRCGFCGPERDARERWLAAIWPAVDFSAVRSGQDLEALYRSAI